jgi:hypothetical protein
VDPQKTKNSEICDFISACRKVVESVNKSKLLKRKLEEAMKKEHGAVVKMRNSPTHRWSSIEDALVHLLKYWKQLILAYNSCSQEFPIKNEIQLLLELRSMIYPVRLRLAQQTKELVVFQVYMQMMHLYYGLLDPRNSLDLYDPSLTIPFRENGANGTETVNAMD